MAFVRASNHTFSPGSALRQITVNDLPVGRSVEETVRLVKAFQFTVSVLTLLGCRFSS